MDWDEYYFEHCDTIALKSKDPSTKVGCVIVGEGNGVLSTGFNGFPRGVDDDAARYQNREIKIDLIEHAERNAIYNAARTGIPLKGSRLYVQWLPCHECARAIIQVGIKEVIVGDYETDNLADRWGKSWAVTRLMFAEAGVKLKEQR